VIRILVVCIFLAGANAADAATIGRLPASACQAPFALFADGFEGAGALYREPSNGAGGAFPGTMTRVINVPGLGNKTYYLQVPEGYSPDRPLPLLLALHGAAGSQALAQAAAQQLRGEWGTVGETGGFIVAAPVASGGSGGWIAPPPSPSDYDVFVALVEDVSTRYNIDRSRLYAWGFSAGGHVLHDLVLGPFSPTLDDDDFAAYAIAAGTLPALACSGLSDAGCNALLDDTREIPFSLQVGTSDPRRAQVSADRDRFLAHGWHADATLRHVEFAGGHTYTQAQLAQTWEFLCPFQRVP